ALGAAALFGPAGDFGLNPPAVAIKVTVEETKRDSQAKTPKTFIVRLGRHDAASRRLFATSQDWPRVNEISDELALALNKGALVRLGRGGREAAGGAADRPAGRHRRRRRAAGDAAVAGAAGVRAGGAGGPHRGAGPGADAQRLADDRAGAGGGGRRQGRRAGR